MDACIHIRAPQKEKELIEQTCIKREFIRITCRVSTMSVFYQRDQEPSNWLFHMVEWLSGINLVLKFQKIPGLQSTLEGQRWILISKMESIISKKIGDEHASKNEIKLVVVSNQKPASLGPRTTQHFSSNSKTGEKEPDNFI